MHQRVPVARFRLASLDGLPDAPAADIFDFGAGRIFDFVPLEYGSANGLTQIVHVEHLAKMDVAGVHAAGDGVRDGKWAKDGYTLGQHCHINDVSLENAESI